MLKRKKSSALDHPLQNHPLPPVLHPRLLHARSTRASQLGQSYPPPPALPVESEGYTVTPWFIWKSPLWMKRKIILKSNRFMTFQNVEKKIWGVSKAHFEIFVQLRLGSCLNTVTIKNGFPSLDCWFPVTPPQPWLTPNLLRTWGGINPQITAVFSKQRTGFFVANVGKWRRLHPLQKY